MLDLVRTETSDRIVALPGAARPDTPRPAPRDWSNVVFSVAFCEEARRVYEQRTAE